MGNIGYIRITYPAPHASTQSPHAKQTQFCPELDSGPQHLTTRNDSCKSARQPKMQNKPNTPEHRIDTKASQTNSYASVSATFEPENKPNKGLSALPTPHSLKIHNRKSPPADLATLPWRNTSQDQEKVGCAYKSLISSLEFSEFVWGRRPVVANRESSDRRCSTLRDGFSRSRKYRPCCHLSSRIESCQTRTQTI